MSHGLVTKFRFPTEYPLHNKAMEKLGCSGGSDLTLPWHSSLKKRILQDLVVVMFLSILYFFLFYLSLFMVLVRTVERSQNVS